MCARAILVNPLLPDVEKNHDKDCERACFQLVTLMQCETMVVEKQAGTAANHRSLPLAACQRSRPLATTRHRLPSLNGAAAAQVATTAEERPQMAIPRGWHGRQSFH